MQDFIGDGILAVFGAPREDPEHAWHAALTAVDMQAAIGRLSLQWEQAGGEGFALGVAVHAGEAFAGVVGSPRQRKYAVVGDTVNTVARLEELNRELGTAILLSGSALGLVSTGVDVRSRGAFAIRGRCHAVDVFELLGLHSSSPFSMSAVLRVVRPRGRPRPRAASSTTRARNGLTIPDRVV